MIRNIRNIIRVSVDVLFLTLMLFIIVNIIIYYNKNLILDVLTESTDDKKPKKYSDYLLNPYAAGWFDIYKEVTGKKRLGYADLSELIRGGEPRGHTVLEYINRVQKGKHYNIGFENIRSNFQGFDDNLEQMLKDGEGVWAFGGSTTFGWLVDDNETWPAYFERIVGAPVVNLGSNGSDFNYQVQHLSYLLRKGYMPKKVVFLIGLNELGKVTTNLEPVDLFTRFEVIERKYDYNKTFKQEKVTFKTAIKTIPVVALYFDLKTRKEKEEIKNKYYNLLKKKFSSEIFAIDNTIEIDIEEQRWLLNHGSEVFEIHKKYFLDKYILYYSKNIAFLKKLGEGFGFDVSVFLQPIAFFDYKNNPFVASGVSQTSYYKTAHAAHDSVRKKISAKKLDMFDLSDILLDSDFPRYTDAGHYTASGNKKIAEEISNHMKN